MMAYNSIPNFARRILNIAISAQYRKRICVSIFLSMGLMLQAQEKAITSLDSIATKDANWSSSIMIGASVGFKTGLGSISGEFGVKKDKLYIYTKLGVSGFIFKNVFPVTVSMGVIYGNRHGVGGSINATNIFNTDADIKTKAEMEDYKHNPYNILRYNSGTTFLYTLLLTPSVIYQYKARNKRWVYRTELGLTWYRRYNLDREKMDFGLWVPFPFVDFTVAYKLRKK
jgi:hypothetical protein